MLMAGARRNPFISSTLSQAEPPRDEMLGGSWTKD